MKGVQLRSAPLFASNTIASNTADHKVCRDPQSPYKCKSKGVSPWQCVAGIKNYPLLDLRFERSRLIIVRFQELQSVTKRVMSVETIETREVIVPLHIDAVCN